jgi:two-component system phosphate regulon response regulator PhoB
MHRFTGFNRDTVAPRAWPSILETCSEPTMRQLTEQEFPAPLRAGDVNLNCETRRITRTGRIIHVSPIAFRLLECLMETPGRLLSRAQLLGMVLGSTSELLTRTSVNCARRLSRMVKKTQSRLYEVPALASWKLLPAIT